MKKVFTLILLSLIAFNAIHAEITWTLSDDGTLTISGTDMPNYDSYSDPYLNYETAPWSYKKDEINKITIENGVKNIGSYAFQGCSNLKSISIPNSVTRIGGDAFYGCSRLSSITIPNSVTSIGHGAFSACSSLTSIVIGKVFTSLKEQFYNCPMITSVTLLDGVTCISGNAFSGYSNPISITIPKSVTSLGLSAFEGCSLTSIIVEKNNAKYDSRNDCNAIIETNSNTLIVGCKNTVIPNSVTSIGYSAFSGCSGLTSITIPNSVTSIGDDAFRYCLNLTSITIENGVTNIGAYAFQGCSNLKSISIPNSVTSIRSSVFEGCSSLTSITIGNSVTSIEGVAFKNCSSLTSINIPNSVTSIGSGAFQGCTSLPSITIPNSVTSVGGYAFSGCSGLTSINIPNTMTSIGDYTFNGCSGLTSINIPNTVTYIGSSAFSGCSALTSITIPESVMSIREKTFSDCSSLVSITIPNSVTSIEAYAFSGCSNLKSISIPNSVTDIGRNAFYDCSSLTFVTIPNNVTSIGASAFYNCCSLTSIFIPNSVTSIGNGAFSWCSSITSITIPNSVKNIGKEAFSGCDDLKDVIINVNKELKIGKSAFYSSVSKIEKISMFGETLPISTENDFVSERIFFTATLSVQTALYNKYRSTSPWQRFSKIEKNKPVVYLRDDESYTSNEQNDIEEISYTRIFSTTSWEALYIPFSISYDDWKNDFELTYIKDIRQIDDNGDNVIDRTIMDVVMIENGDIVPNTPYLIRAKSIGNKTFIVNNAPLSKSEENSMDYSTTIAKFTFTGTYNPISSETLKANDYYVMANGSLKKADDASELLPYRWYMKAESRTSSYNISNLAKMITVNVVEEGATGVRELRTTDDRYAIYDLNGRMVNEKYLKSGLYIKNGKKVVIK